MTTNSADGKTYKHAHLSEPHPALIPLLPILEAEGVKSWAPIWTEKPDMVAFRKQFEDGNFPVADHHPQPGQDYEVHDETITVRDGASIGMRFYAPLQANRTGKEVLVMKFHGGGCVLGSHEIEEVENRLLAAKAGAVVASVDYRLAPEYKFPYAVNDCFDAMKWCAANAQRLGVDKDKIVVAGGSAGGYLASAIALKAKNEGFKEGRIVGFVANIPALCHPKLFPKEKFEHHSIEQNAHAPIMGTKELLWCWEQIVPDLEADLGAPTEYHSPLLAKDLRGMPPSVVQVAGLDPLRDEGIAWAEALKEAGNEVDLRVYPGLPHGFYRLEHLEETGEYWQASVDFVKKLAKD